MLYFLIVIIDDFSGLRIYILRKRYDIDTWLEGLDMKTELFRNILINLLNLYFFFYECLKILNDRKLCLNKFKRVFFVSRNKNFSDIKVVC